MALRLLGRALSLQRCNSLSFAPLFQASLARRSFFQATTPLRAASGGDDKKKGKGKVEKTFSSGEVYGTGKQRQLPDEILSLKKRSLKLKGGAGRKKKQIKKKVEAGLAFAQKKEEKTKTRIKVKRHNLYDVLRTLPRNGVGFRVYRSSWLRYQEPSFWTIVKVIPAMPGHKCRIFGVHTWRGVTELNVRRVNGAPKREWRHIAEPDMPPVHSETAASDSPTQSSQQTQTA
eukprot:TRINITY_DN507_c0_g1_i1.p1 TRINITY_DN507_c0_g1~~TRINITY_DN507_c0_g1_i1.p1  ORF type:complete len:231 (+),score=41.07 TRINITY_DN507_c0_g1_i1:57-749(+)